MPTHTHLILCRRCRRTFTVDHHRIRAEITDHELDHHRNSTWGGTPYLDITVLAMRTPEPHPAHSR